MELLIETYRVTRRLPRDEQFVLVAQMRRAALSIPCNIVEGNERNTAPDRRQFFTTAKGSAGELDTQLEAVFQLQYLNEDDLETAERLVDRAGRMLAGLIKNVRPHA